MKRARLTLVPRQQLLASVAGSLTVGAFLLCWLVIPAYDAWQDVRGRLTAQAKEYRDLAHNVSIKSQVVAQIQAIDKRCYQQGSDEVMLSAFLQEIETLSRERTVVLVSAGPEPAEDHTTYKVYGCKLLLSGALQDVIRFAHDLCHRDSVVGMNGFTLRATQKGREVECALSIWMVSLVPDALIKHKPVPGRLARPRKVVQDE